MRIIDVAFRGVESLDADKLAFSRHSPAVLEVPADTPALEAARQAEEQGASLIVVTDGNEVAGVVAPASALQRISSFRGSQPERLTDAFAEMLVDPSEQARGFHHERLNYERPELFVCQVGPHYTDEWPCKYHKGNQP